MGSNVNEGPCSSKWSCLVPIYLSTAHLCNQEKITRLQDLMPGWAIHLSSGSDGRSTRSSAADSQRRKGINVKQCPHWDGLVIVEAYSPVTETGRGRKRWDGMKEVRLADELWINCGEGVTMVHGRKLSGREGVGESAPRASLQLFYLDLRRFICRRQYPTHYLEVSTWPKHLQKDIVMNV